MYEVISNKLSMLLISNILYMLPFDCNMKKASHRGGTNQNGDTKQAKW